MIQNLVFGMAKLVSTITFLLRDFRLAGQKRIELDEMPLHRSIPRRATMALSTATIPCLIPSDKSDHDH